MMLYVRSLLLKSVFGIEEKHKYGIPFYYVNNKPLCYLNVLKGTEFVDIAFVKGVELQVEFSILKDYKNRKYTRSLQLETIESLDEVEFEKLILRATELNLKKIAP
ncbi:MAG: 2-dehydro-3-deoxyphosphooctonate aldolase [Flavobacteriaceae bacterium]|nr:MAG: 2-dehydro-3-deoxyphosphooctonate aldolase [Flavobacteriaceae bacterium]